MQGLGPYWCTKTYGKGSLGHGQNSNLQQHLLNRALHNANVPIIGRNQEFVEHYSSCPIFTFFCFHFGYNIIQKNSKTQGSENFRYFGPIMDILFNIGLLQNVSDLEFFFKYKKTLILNKLQKNDFSFSANKKQILLF